MSIFFNNSRINDWYYNSSDIIKVYHNGAVCYYKLAENGSYKVCFAVVDDITQYHETEFEDVFDKATEKWYKLNNLNEYEEYGIYASGRTECSGSSRLPDGYTEVEYISSEDISESVLGAYIDTNYKPTQNTRFVIEYQSTTNTRDYQRIFGSGEFDMLGYLVNIEGKIGTSGYYYYKFGQTSSWYTTNVQCDLNRHIIDYNNSKQFLLDNVSIATLPNTSFTCSSNLGIFWSINTKYTTNNINFIGRIFSAKVYENGILVRDFVPCISPNNVVGMYDIVNNVFYTSSNNYSFKAGEPITPTDCVTTYNGKLTIDDGYEYEWNGSSWVNLGEVTGSTATLPDVPFTLNYNAKNYNASTHTIPYTEGALNAIDAVITGETANIIDHSSDGYIQLTGSNNTTVRALVGTTNFSRSSSSPNITIVCKAYTPGSSMEGNILSNRKESYNWMYRHKSNQLIFHGSSEQGSIAVSNTEPNTCSVRIDSSRLLRYNNWTQNTTSTYSNFNYGSNSNGGALFAGYYSSTGEYWKGVFYWIYMSLNTLTDEQVQQVIDYNEGGGGQSDYPKYYTEKSDPLNDLTFNTLAEAQTYAYNNCVYDGMKATIDGKNYVFDSEDGWVEKMHSLPNVPFMLNYNAKEYDASTKTLPKTEGQLRDSDAVCNYGYHIVDHSADGYITVTGNTRMVISGTPYFNRTNTLTGCTMTIVSKVKTTNVNESYSILTNRGDYGTMNWMWRYPSNGIFLHGSSTYNSPKYFTSTTEQPITTSIRISYDGSVKQLLNDWTNNGSYNGAFQYGSAYSGNNAMFCDYTSINAEFWKGDFYWVYMSQEVLTDEQIQQVIDYNENL